MKLMLLAFLCLAATAVAGDTLVGGPTHPSGAEVDLDLPAERHQANMGGSDGAGLCVFTAIGMAADWAHLPGLVDFRDYMTRHPGGGYPEKVDRFLRRLCQERGLPEPAYLQIETKGLDLLAAAVRQGRMPAVTYTHSPTGRYGGRRIAHMVNLVAARAGARRLWAVLDNNYPGSLEWMTEAEFHACFSGLGQGWAVILLEPGPPPPPWNVDPSPKE